MKPMKDMKKLANKSSVILSLSKDQFSMLFLSSPNGTDPSTSSG
jgi:hypothetical protein